MNRTRASLDAFLRDERGSTAIEYGLVVGLISLTIIPWATQIGQSVVRFFQAMSEGLSP